MSETHPKAVLDEARKQAAAACRHREALETHLWFHEHALTHEPFLRGVRLSFALVDWHRLATVYEPAIVALLATRDPKVAQIRSGDWPFDGAVGCHGSGH